VGHRRGPSSLSDWTFVGEPGALGRSDEVVSRRTGPEYSIDLYNDCVHTFNQY